MFKFNPLTGKFDLVTKDAPLIESYPPLSYHLFGNGFQPTAASFVLVPDKIEGYACRIEYPCTLQASRINITGAAAGAAVVGMYKYDFPTDTFNLVCQTDPATPFNLGSATTQEAAYAAPVVMSPGIYANVILGNSAATLYNIRRESPVNYFGYSLTIGTTSDKSYVSFATPYATVLPSSFPGSANVGFRVGALLPLILQKTT